MPINAGYEYEAAEKKFHDAQTNEERLKALNEMLSTAPKHKGTGSLLKNIKERIKKYKDIIFLLISELIEVYFFISWAPAKRLTAKLLATIILATEKNSKWEFNLEVIFFAPLAKANILPWPKV